MPRLIVGCPIADRAWALPRWFSCLAGQTRRPDGFAFIHSGRVHDATWVAIQQEAARHQFRSVLVHHDPALPHARHDNTRFQTLGRLRNHMLRAARFELGADLVLSLDTDVMLEHPDTIERLERMVTGGECDVASAVTFLHPQAPRHWTAGEPAAWAYNFGFFPDPDEPPGPARTWARPDPSGIPWGERIPIDVPMAVWLGNRRAMGCRYEPHESGEDVGYAQSLAREGVRCIVDTLLYAFHAWSPEHLREQLDATTEVAA